jgi:hypothetical protein
MDTEALLRQYLAAYEARDIVAIDAMLAPEVCLQDWNLRAVGKMAVLCATRTNFTQASSLGIEVLSVLTSPQRVAAPLRITVNHGTAQAAVLEVVDILSFNEAGLIVDIRAYKG